MARIRHIAITAEDPFATAELFKKGFGLEEIGRGDSELAREVYLTDGYINVAIVCWKRTKETPNPYPEGYGLDHFGIGDRKSTRLNSSHVRISYAVFCLKKKKTKEAQKECIITL